MISTNYEKFYIKGEKSGANTITLSSHYLINVEIEEKTSNLNGNVSYDVVGNGTKNVDITFTYSDLYINGETYNATVTASDGIDTLIIPVIINCSDTLIYVSSDSTMNIEDGIDVTYTSLPEVDSVHILTDEGIKIDVTSKLNNQTFNFSKLDAIEYVGWFNSAYIQADNNLSKISHKIEGNIGNDSKFQAIYHSNINRPKMKLWYRYDEHYDSMPIWNVEVYGGQSVYNNYFSVPLDADGIYPVSKRWLVTFDFKSNSIRHFFDGCEDLQKVLYMDTSGVTHMDYLFEGCTSLTSIPLLDTSMAKEIDHMFCNCTSLTSIPLLDTSMAKDTDHLFYGCSSLKSIPLLNTSNITSTDYMFEGCTSLTSIPSLDTKNVRSMLYMFCNCTSLTSIPSLDTSNLVDASGMFMGCKSLTTVPKLNASNMYWTSGMFSGCASLTNLGGFVGLGESGSDDLSLSQSPLLTHESLMNVINNLSDTHWQRALFLHVDSLNKLTDDEIKIATDKGWSVRRINTSSKFRGIYNSNANREIMKLWNEDEYTPMKVYNATINGSKQTSNLFTVPRQNAYPVEKDWHVEFDFENDSLRCAFMDCEDLTSVLYMDISNVTDMGSTFEGCTSLTSIPQLNTSKVTDMGGTFYRCTSLNSIPLLDTSNVTELYQTFYRCTSLTSIPQLNTSKVERMDSTFHGCTSLTSIPQLNTSNVTYMGGTFYGCTSLTSIPQLNTSNVTDMGGTFYGCTSLTSIPQLNTSNVTYMGGTFYGCTSLTSIPQLNTSNVTSMDSTFRVCTSLTSIPQLDTSNVNYMGNAFYFCTSLTDLGGFIGLKTALDLSYSPLTHESLMNVINNLAVVSSSPILSLGPTNLTKLTDDEIKIATDKGWIVS